MGIPQVEQTNTRRKGIKRGKTAILTSSPYLTELKADQRQKQRKVTGTARIQLFPENKGKAGSGITGKGKAKNRGTAKKTAQPSEAEVREEENPECIYCTSRFVHSKSGEQWIRCDACHKWAHEDCAALSDNEKFVCEFCME